MRRAVRLLLPCVLLLVPVAAAGDEREPLAAVARRVEEIRGLTFAREVEFSRVDRAAVREYAARRLELFSRPEAIRAEETAYALLGLVPPGTAFAKEYEALVEAAAGGYYDPGSKRYFILEGLPAGAGPILAAHELTHALEDERYDLDARIASARDDADRAFAVMAVHEGTASLVMAVYVSEGLRRGWVVRADLEALAGTETARGTRIAEAPAFLRRPLLGAYVLGTRFLIRGRDEVPGLNGFPVADAERVYGDGPLSSEQILHPEKYWDPARRDDPLPVRIPDPRPALGGEGWTKEGEGVLGELLLGPLVEAPTPATWDPVSIRGQGWTCPPAAGWGGDRWELWSRGERRVVLLVTRWDSTRDAREFASAIPVRRGLSWKRSGDRVAVVAGDLSPRDAARVARKLAAGATSAASSR